MSRVSIGIIGGKLQGVEIAYLSKRAGYRVILFDKNPSCIAKRLADEFICTDVLRDDLIAYFKKCDFLMPAVEDEAVLAQVQKIAEKMRIPYIHDSEAYSISSSKIISDEMFRKLELASPAYYPEGHFPYIIKPSGLSGSQGVKKVYSEKELEEEMLGKDWSQYVIQEYIGGPSYSIEVIGDGVNYYPLTVTEIITDKQYDCCCVETVQDDNIKQMMYDLGNGLGEALKIKGIFDIETIYYKGKMYLLEIDARFPSQTPSTVYHANGLNMVELLYNLLVKKDDFFCIREIASSSLKEKHVIFQHIKVSRAKIDFLGEHIMGEANFLEQADGLFDCDTVLTDYHKNKDEWVATLILSDEGSRHDAERRMKKILDKIFKMLSIKYAAKIVDYDLKAV